MIIRPKAGGLMALSRWASFLTYSWAPSLSVERDEGADHPSPLPADGRAKSLFRGAAKDTNGYHEGCLGSSSRALLRPNLFLVGIRGHLGNWMILQIQVLGKGVPHALARVPLHEA